MNPAFSRPHSTYYDYKSCQQNSLGHREEFYEWLSLLIIIYNSIAAAITIVLFVTRGCRAKTSPMRLADQHGAHRPGRADRPMGGA